MDTRRPFETLFDELYPDPVERRQKSWLLEAVRVHQRWGQGREVTEDELRAALEEVGGITLGGGRTQEV